MTHEEFTAAIAARVDQHLIGLSRFTADAAHPEVAALARQTQAALRQVTATFLLAFSQGPDAFEALEPVAEAPAQIDEPVADDVPPPAPPEPVVPPSEPPPAP